MATPKIKPAKSAPPPFAIVAIGASAGGLEALELFLRQVPTENAKRGAAYVVIQHLDPHHKGMLTELLQRATRLPVAQAKNRMKVKPGHVYVIPPKWDLSILHDTLYLLEPVAPRGLRLPIDLFFRALADDRHEQAICVILSGMGSDGTLGLRAIKANGGLVLVQEPASAKFDAMPQSAIDTGLVDIVAPPAALPLRIADYLQHVPGILGATHAETESLAQKSAFAKICILLREHTGNDFSLYKKSTIYRRVERRMGLHQIERIAHYVNYLRENPQEIDLLFKELLIGVTSFFRDAPAWNCLQTHLQNEVLPAMLSAGATGAVLRAWVAGCSTGEEAYTLAMIFREAQQQLKLSGHHGHPALQIFATDLDTNAINSARRACYPANIAADVSAERLKRFFVEEGKGYRVAKEIREMVVFATQNAIMDPPFTHLDIITCRNLMIYLGPELQKKLIPLFHYSLKAGGILMLGSAESVGNFTDLFETLDNSARIFQRGSSPLRPQALEFPSRALPRDAETFKDAERNPAPDNLQRVAEQLLLQQFSPAAVLVTAAGDVLYSSGDTGKYLSLASGKANWNIHAMLREELRHALGMALPKALSRRERVVCHNLRLGNSGGNGSARSVDITVQPLDKPESLRDTAMVVFAEVVSDAPALPAAGATAGKGAARRNPRVLQLERALQQAQQEVRDMREEMQSSQEEIKSSNEELQSTNEELQSTNEELTTSKEEMQSLNEELQTVNAELQSKVDDLSSTSNDMKNLLNSTDMATIFLDATLCLRRFTTQATKLFRLLPGDVGRPLSDLASDLAYPDLPGDAEEVLRSLALSEREITTGDGRWFQIKIMPYRTLDNVIDGVVITFNDIGRAKTLEAELRKLAGKK